MSTHSKPSHGLRSLLSLRRTQGEREGTRDALESLREPLESRRKPLVRADSFPSHDPEDTRKAALTRAYAEMFDLSDRFNTETEET